MQVWAVKLSELQLPDGRTAPYHITTNFRRWYKELHTYLMEVVSYNKTLTG